MAGDELVVALRVCACICIAAITCNLRRMKDARMKLKHSHLNGCKVRAVNKVVRCPALTPQRLCCCCVHMTESYSGITVFKHVGI